MHADLVDADQQLAPSGACVRADMDDTYMLGPIDQVLPVALRAQVLLEMVFFSTPPLQGRERIKAHARPP